MFNEYVFFMHSQENLETEPKTVVLELTGHLSQASDPFLSVYV